ncbi:hypothetical protein [Belliella kenyensis]|nr:hypothetical protein [Belliella kenyensis]MDN3604325.1 hypothetical protein [Belliella kenyensis]
MMIGAAFGQTPSLSSFASGSLGSLVGSATHNLGAVGQIAGSSLMGGIGAELSGGDFWRGAAVGATVSSLNHLAHRVQNDQWETKGKYEKSGKYIGQHRVIKQKNGYTAYADKKGSFFTIGPDGQNVDQEYGMFSYFPGGKNFKNTHVGQSKLGIYIREHFVNHLDNVLWFFGPKMPYGTMPGQPYFGPGLPLENPNNSNINL